MCTWFFIWNVELKNPQNLRKRFAPVILFKMNGFQSIHRSFDGAIQERMDNMIKGALIMNMRKTKRIQTAIALTAIFTLALAAPALAISSKTAKEIDGQVVEALAEFNKTVDGGSKLLGEANGALVFPKVYKAGFGIGGEHGKGVLQIGGKTVDYYSTSAASFGLQFGGQKKTIVLVFLKPDALKKFRLSEGWEVGVDGSVALIDIGAGGSVDTTNIKDPIIAFVFGQAGLMYNLTLEGSKMQKLKVE
jgi:lipid-binding SYLF domain-containing protein